MRLMCVCLSGIRLGGSLATKNPNSRAANQEGIGIPASER